MTFHKNIKIKNITKKQKIHSLLLIFILIISFFIVTSNNKYNTEKNENSREYWSVLEKANIIDYLSGDIIGRINDNQKIYGDLIKYKNEIYILSDINNYSVLIEYDEENIFREKNPKQDSKNNEKNNNAKIFMLKKEISLNIKNQILGNITMLNTGFTIIDEDKNNYYYNCFGFICSINKETVTLINE